jgi:hypothetical protein
MSDANQGKRAGADLGRTSRLLAVMLLLLAGWFGWSAYSQWRNEAIGVALEEARDAAVVGLHQAMTEQAAQMTKVLALAEVKAALAGGDADAAAVTVRGNWPGAEDVQVMGSALDVAYADAANFGYSAWRCWKPPCATRSRPCAWSATRAASAWAWPPRPSWARPRRWFTYACPCSG